jgi:[ribosomal protein S18]-alanine N-acetyltransferase
MSAHPTPNPPVEVCPAATGDLKRIRRLNDEAGLSPWPVSDYEALRRRSDAVLAVARRGGRLVGFHLSLAAAGDLELLKIAVARGDRRQGVGRALLEDCFAAGRRRGCLVCYLEVRAGDNATVPFYRRNRFRTLLVRRNYYRDPVEDALLMVREL